MNAQLEYSPTADVPLGVTEELNEATRWMCSRLLVDRRKAVEVFELYCVPQVAAVAPSPGVDMPALARHAAWAVDDDRRACAAVAGLWGGVALALAAAALLALDGRAWWPPLAVAGALVVVGVVLLSGRMAARHGRARQVATADHVERIADDLVDAAQLRRLDEATDGNLLVYEERGLVDDPAYLVFPGFGDVAGQSVQVPVDVGQPLDPDDDPGRVEPYELLRHLEKAVPRHIDRTEITVDKRSSVVAHVRGAEVPQHDELLVRADGPVVDRAHLTFVRTAANRPTRGVRGYVRASAIGHSGQLVTTLHMSAAVGTTGMSLNFVLHVIRPLTGEWAAATSVPAGGGGRRWRVLRSGEFWRLLVLAPDEWWRLRGLAARARAGASVPKRRRLSRRRPSVSYGATTGLRHLASAGRSLTFNERLDLERQAHDLMAATFTEARAFLAGRNIDPSALAAQAAGATASAIVNITANAIGEAFDAAVTAQDDDG